MVVTDITPNTSVTSFAAPPSVSQPIQPSDIDLISEIPGEFKATPNK